jgi:tetratricopeptide (TPR) repeat protein
MGNGFNCEFDMPRNPNLDIDTTDGAFKVLSRKRVVLTSVGLLISQMGVLAFLGWTFCEVRPALAKDSAYEKMELGQVMYFNGNINGAIREFQAAVALNPKLWEAHINLANMYMEKGEVPSVIAEYREVLKLKPNNKDIWLMLGNLQQSQGDFTGAAETFSKAIEFGANTASTYFALGLTLLQINDPMSATYNFSKAVEEQPNFAEAHLMLGVSLFKGGAKSKLQAFDEVDKAIEQRKRYPEAHNIKGDMYASEGNEDEALFEYETAIKEAPSFSQAWNSAANIYYSRKEYAKAAEGYARALELDPHFKDACYGLGLALEQQGRLYDGITAIRHGLGMDKDRETKEKMIAHLNKMQEAYLSQERLGKPIAPSAQMTEQAKKLLEDLAPKDQLQNNPDELLKLQMPILQRSITPH